MSVGLPFPVAVLLLFELQRGRIGDAESPLPKLIEGYSDHKGTRESNLAAGERRAKAAASALVKQGAPGPRMWIVSYGSDRPICTEKTDACAAKNRRVHFKIKKLQ